MADIAAQKAVLKALLSLPRPVLRALSGGGAVYVGGRTLDPRLQFLAHQARRFPPISTLTPEQARAAADQGFAMSQGKREPGVRVEALSVDGAESPIPARAYLPPSLAPEAAVIVFLHQGGGVLGGLDSDDAFCSILAHCAKSPVLSIDYRLAPEHRFPAGLQDCLAAYRWARANTGRFGVAEGRLALSGDSMGGNFTAVITQTLKRAGEPQPVLQLLVYPAVDLASETQSMTTYADSYPLSRDTMVWFVNQYLGPGDDPADVRLSPIREPDLSGLAPAIVATAGFDPLCDQGEAYAKRLMDAGVPTVFRCYESLCHSFCSFTGVAPAADTACREIAGLVAQGLRGELPEPAHARAA